MDDIIYQFTNLSYTSADNHMIYHLTSHMIYHLTSHMMYHMTCHMMDHMIYCTAYHIPFSSGTLSVPISGMIS